MIWEGLMLLSGSFTVFIWWKGGQWREAAEAREAEDAKCFDLASTSNILLILCNHICYWVKMIFFSFLSIHCKGKLACEPVAGCLRGYDKHEMYIPF